MGTLDQLTGTPVTLPNYEAWTTVTVVNSLTTNATTVAKRRCSFEYAEYDIVTTFTGANTQGVMQITLPSGDVIDTSVFSDPVNYNLDPLNSKATWTKSAGVARGLGGVFANTTTTVRIYDVEALVGATFVASTPLQVYSNTVDTSANRPFTFASGDSISVRFQVPLVRLAGGMTVVGAGLATSVKAGLISAASPQINIAAQVSSGQAGFSVIRAVATAYSDSSGVWNARGHIEASFTSVVTTSNLSVGLTIANTVFKTGTSQAVPSAWGGSNAVTNGLANGGTGNISVYSNATSGAANATNVRISFDVELDSKPTWA